MSQDEFYLSDVSPKDKPWDYHQGFANQVRDLYFATEFYRYAERIARCAQLLEFVLITNDDGETLLRLRSAQFCRVRHCPVCQWRRSMMWKARFFQAMPEIEADHPTARFIFLTLTVRNCQLTELRNTLSWMNKSWERLSQRKQFPAIGWVKSVEVTSPWNVYYDSAFQGRMTGREFSRWRERKRNYDSSLLQLGSTGEAHPHFHSLLMVPSSYFGQGYLSQQKWADLWQKSLRSDYTPLVDVRAIKPQKGGDMASAVKETLKYSVKPEDLVADPSWLQELTSQLHRTRAIAVGGVLRRYLTEDDPEDLIHADNPDSAEEDGNDDDPFIYFGWREMIRRYVKRGNRDNGQAL